MLYVVPLPCFNHSLSFLQLSDSSNENDSYFADPEVAPTVPQDHHTHELSIPARRATDDSEYVIPIGRQEGVWGMIKRVGRFRGEGWLALWKGKRQ